MNKGTAVRILDVLIFIAIVLLIYILVQPQFVNYRNQTIEAQIKANAYTVKAAIEHYIADNMGVYPKGVDDFWHYVDEEGGIVNPLTGEEIIKTEIHIFKYDLPQDYKDDSPGGMNSQQKGTPGSIGVGFFIPIGDTLVKHYGVIGFNKSGNPLFYLDPAKKRHIFVIYG